MILHEDDANGLLDGAFAPLRGSLAVPPDPLQLGLEIENVVAVVQREDGPCLFLGGPSRESEQQN
jgi:hypothetical protein